jgi:hypothetical protein
LVTTTIDSLGTVFSPACKCAQLSATHLGEVEALIEAAKTNRTDCRLDINKEAEFCRTNSERKVETTTVTS